MTDRLIGEAVALAGPAYFFLQLLMLVRYRGGWRWAALVPLIAMIPLAVHAAALYAAGSQSWPVLLFLAAPPACLYLLVLAIAKAALGTPMASERR